jgi:hypothetical protein
VANLIWSLFVMLLVPPPTAELTNIHLYFPLRIYIR